MTCPVTLANNRVIQSPQYVTFVQQECKLVLSGQDRFLARYLVHCLSVIPAKLF